MTTFRHESLDHNTTSIRLLKILASLSEEGHIQCTIWHSTLSAEYTCLSYAWGPKNSDKLVLINGLKFHIRKNLWDFLELSRIKHSEQPRVFWIDALSISQESISERNHQVAQMGQIYSNAIEVFSWLGHDESVRRAAESLLAPEFSADLALNVFVNRWEQLKLSSNGQLKRDWVALVKNDYWKRAWITQELYLARKLTFLVGDLEIDATHFTKMESIVGNINNADGDIWMPTWDLDSDVRIFITYIGSFSRKKPLSKPKLIELFYHLPGRLCHYPRARVYSILPIASDASGISIDYDSPINHVLLQLLRVYSASICVCYCFYIVDMLKCSPDPWSDSLLEPHVFKIPMIIMFPEFIMGPDPASWHYACSACHRTVPYEYQDENSDQISFCVKELCDNIPSGHLQLNKHVTEYSKRYTISGEPGTADLDVIHVEVAKNRAKHDWHRTVITLNVYLEINVVMELFCYDDNRHSPTDIPFRICTGARQRQKLVAFIENLDADTLNFGGNVQGACKCDILCLCEVDI